MLPKISIVMSAYNVAAFIEYAALSIYFQTYKNYQLIVVDDGSTDATSEKLMRCQSMFDIHIITAPKNIGLPAALNLGMAAADGDFIARFDPDDFMQDWRLRDQVIFLMERMDVDLVGGGAIVFGLEDYRISPKTSDAEIKNEFLVGNPFLHPTIMFRRKLLDKGLFIYKGGLQTDEDYELWSRLLPKIKAANIPNDLIKYRIHSTNGQRNPGKKLVKKKAITQFLQAYDIDNDALATALAEYQCSRFLSPNAFAVMKEYAGKRGKGPKLGWLHERLAGAKSYINFIADIC